MPSQDSASSALAAEVTRRLGNPDLTEYICKHSGELSEDVIEALQKQARASFAAKDFPKTIGLFEACAEIARLLGLTPLRLKLLESICAFHMQAGDKKAMVAKGLLARQEALAALRQVPEASGHFVRLSMTLAEEATDDVAFGRRLLAETRTVCQDQQIIGGLLWTELLLTKLCLKENDTPRARDYAANLKHDFTLLQDGAKYVPPPPTRDHAALTIVDVAKVYYYTLEDFDGAAGLAEMAVDLAPNLLAGLIILGHSLGRLEKYSEAESVWAKVVQLVPGDASAYFNYGGTKAALSQYEDAIPLVTKAIELAPRDVKYVRARGDLFRATAQYEKALADYRVVVALCEEAIAAEREVKVPSKPRTNIEYERNTPLRDVADFARTAMVACLIQLGRTDQAFAESDELIRTGDAPTRRAGFMFKAQLFEGLKRTSDAIDAVTGALGALPADTGALSLRAKLYCAADRIDEAIPDLALLADRNRDPKLAAEKLGEILERKPGHALALKWRGFAWFEQWKPSMAVADLSVAARELTNDWQVHLWLGLSLILFSPHPEERAWSEGLSYARIEQAIREVGTAAKLNPDETEPLMTYKWLVDHVGCDHLFFEKIVWEGEQPNGFFSVIPAAREPVERYFRSFQLAAQRLWPAAVAELKAAQEGFLKAGLPVLAGLLDLHLADNYLRLYHLQDAADSLERLEKWTVTQVRPLSSILHGRAESISDSVQKRSGQSTALVELDYMGIYSIGQEDIRRSRRLITAQLLSRTGNSRAALTALGDVGEFFDNVKRAARTMSFQSLLAVAMIVRDAGEPQRALELLLKLEPIASSARDQAALANTQGVTCQSLGRTDEAVRYFNVVQEKIGAESKLISLAVDLNQAQTHLFRGEAAQGLEILDRINIEQATASDYDKLGYYQIRSHILLQLSRYPEAEAASERAIATAESMRETLLSFQARISLLGRFVQVYRTAVRIALVNRDTVRAFNLLEKSKARAFLDQMAAGHLPVPQEGKAQQALLERLGQKKQVLTELRVGAEDETAPVNLELVARLNKLDAELDVFEKDIAPPRLSRKRIDDHLNILNNSVSRLQQEVEQIMLRHWDQKTGAVLTIPQIAAILSGSSHDTR